MILSTPLGRLESKLGIIRDWDGIVPTNYFMAITATAFEVLLVMTSLDVTIAVVDP